MVGHYPKLSADSFELFSCIHLYIDHCSHRLSSKRTAKVAMTTYTDHIHIVQYGGFKFGDFPQSRQIFSVLVGVVGRRVLYEDADCMVQQLYSP